MVIRVELTLDAVNDLEACLKTGSISKFLAKLVRLEDVGKDAGQPLGIDLTGLRKIVVGDRTWRIVFRTDPADSVATVLAIAKRDDAEVYELATRRLQTLGNNPEVVTLAAALVQLLRPPRGQTKKRSRF